MTNSVTCTCHNNLGMSRVEVSDDVLDTLQGVGMATVSIALIRLGVKNSSLPGLSPRTPQQSFAGTAFTYRTLPVREDVEEANKNQPGFHPVAYDSIGRRQVLVVDARGDLSARVMGDLYATRVATAGGVAVVTDGAVGDTPGMQGVGLAVYSRGTHVRGFGGVHMGVDHNVPISCAGVLVMPGDVIVGDAESVIVVPQALAAQVAEAVKERDIADQFSLEKLKAGEKLQDVYPPKGRFKEEFDAWMKARKG